MTRGRSTVPRFKKQHGLWGTLDELREDLVARDHVRNAADVRLHLGEPHWWASAQSETGWIFAIGSDGDHTFYAEGAAEPDGGPQRPSEEGWELRRSARVTATRAIGSDRGQSRAWCYQ